MSNTATNSFSAPAVLAAIEWIRSHDAQTLAFQAEVTEIPAPPFCEDIRGDWIAERFNRLGLREVHRDDVGNVLGWLSGSGTQALVVSAHLDTVFPPETDVTVTREGTLLQGPGISDDGRGLAALLALAGAFQATGLTTDTPVLMVATVGEEGVGDLRGVKHLFREDGPLREATGFISLDGAGIDRIVSRGIGSYRFRATITGQGGHSWVDFGIPNPLHALARAITGWTAMDLPESPATTCTVARTGGGTSINAIPAEAWAEVDLRSEDVTTLDALSRQALNVAESIVASDSAGVSEGQELRLDIQVLGQRPAGSCDPASHLLEAAVSATEEVGGASQLIASSTDANVAMALGIPAVTLGAGGEAGLAHTTDEWYRNERGAEGIIRALLTIVGSAGLE